MICNNVKIDEVNGKTNIPLQPIVANILTFIDKYLPLFPKSLVKSQLAGEIETEKILNQQLIDFFNGNSPDHNEYLQYRFLFRKDDENKGTNYKPDIGVTIWNKSLSFSDVKSFFQIECKRLPTPNISSTRSEKEYVKGIEENTGGIERFKNNKHGEHLSEAAIIGFVQEKTLDEWHSKITEWVRFEVNNNNFTWKEEDYLQPYYKNNLVHKYISNCHRINGTTIKLSHFLLNLLEN